MAIKYQCDGCIEIYDTFREAWECHAALNPDEPTYWQQMMLEDIAEEMDCG